jgi:hypothetical protein
MRINSSNTAGSKPASSEEDALLVGMLADAGLMTIGDDGAWRLTVLGETAMRRFYSGYQCPAR